MSRQPEVTRLRQRDAQAATDCLTRAFLPDPLWLALLPDANVRQQQLTGMFRATIRTALHGDLPLATPGISAVAVWEPPRRRMLMSALRSGFAEERWVLSLPAPERRRVSAVFRRLAQRRNDLMPSPHWYLKAIGVEPTHQGRGLGAHAAGQEVVLSAEHENYRWADYETAQTLLRFDSNKNALWELDYRLTGESKAS